MKILINKDFWTYMKLKLTSLLTSHPEPHNFQSKPFFFVLNFHKHECFSLI